jgi:AcrR family transcriptional regulator
LHGGVEGRRIGGFPKQQMKQMSKAAPVARPRGRPPKSAAAIGNEAGLSRSTIIEKVLELTKAEPLQDVSITLIARELGVVPGLIYYYIGNRDNLVSGVMNQFYENRMRTMAPLTGDWRTDVEDIARTNLKLSNKYPGVAHYIVSSRGPYRLFQTVSEHETDFGMVYFDHMSAAFLQGGFTPEQAALAYRLLAQFVASCFAPRSTAPGVSTAEQVKQRFEELDDESYPSAKTVGAHFSALKTKDLFEAGLELLLDGFETWLER